jgi:RHS repeat-associated protein
MAYDNNGWLGTIATSGPGTGQPTVTLTYGYNSSGDVTTIKDSLSGSGAAGQGVATYVYDNALRLGTIAQSLGGTAYGEVTMSYDPGGRLLAKTMTIGGTGTWVSSTYTYDAANNVTEILDAKEHISQVSGDTFDLDIYDPDAAGRTASVTYSDGNSTNTLSYDSSGQLTGSGDSQDDSYSYDLNGNRDSTGYATGAGNELTNSPGVTYAYDNDGNIISAVTSTGTTTYTYDYEDRMTNATLNGTVIATYTYNAFGQRIGIKDSGTQTWTVFNGKSADANPYADFSSSGSLAMRYLSAPAVDQVLGQTSAGGVTSWYITDKLGSVQDVVSPNGNILDHVVYDSFGNITSQTNASDDVRFGFAGMEYDSTTGLYYDHARYYDAVIGRFVSQDPMGFRAGDTDLYRYVGNAPTDTTDISGMATYPVSAIRRPDGSLNRQAPGTRPNPGIDPVTQPGPRNGGTGYPNSGRGPNNWRGYQSSRLAPLGYALTFDAMGQAGAEVTFPVGGGSGPPFGPSPPPPGIGAPAPAPVGPGYYYNRNMNYFNQIRGR